MNKQIKKLVKKAGATINEGFDGNKDFIYGITMSPEECEKFAELIVRECIGIVENNNPCPPGTIKMYSLLQDEYFDKGWQVAAETKSNQIKKHFGVE